jgi:UDP-N-acetylglucosamine transferase subunit ALG13
VIFVTVGTTLPFDALIEAVDRLAGVGTFGEPVLCQIGNGRFEPKHCDFYRFKPSLDEDVELASLIIGHGGTGTVTSLLVAGKPFIAVANPIGAGDHQRQFLARLSKVASFLWTADLAELPGLVDRARTFLPQTTAGERLTDDLKRFLLQTRQ